MAAWSANSEPSPFLRVTASPADSGSRLDQFLARMSGLSRAQVQRRLAAGLVRVNGGSAPASYRLRAGDDIILTLPPPEPSLLVPEPLPLEILYEDEDIILVNKPPGLVVHPAPGHRGGTLLNALLAHCPDLARVGDLARPGLVHRLDKDTSGVMVVAKTEAAHASLTAQFRSRSIEREIGRAHV